MNIYFIKSVHMINATRIAIRTIVHFLKEKWAMPTSDSHFLAWYLKQTNQIKAKTSPEAAKRNVKCQPNASLATPDTTADARPPIFIPI